MEKHLHAKVLLVDGNRSPAPHYRPIRPLYITNYSAGTCLNEPGALDKRLHTRVMPDYEVFR